MVYTSTGAAGAARRGTDDSVYTQFQRKAARRIMSNVHAAARSLAVFLFWASCEILILTTVHTIANLRWCIGNCGAPCPRWLCARRRPCCLTYGAVRSNRKRSRHSLSAIARRWLFCLYFVVAPE